MPRLKDDLGAAEKVNPDFMKPLMQLVEGSDGFYRDLLTPETLKSLEAFEEKRRDQIRKMQGVMK